MNLGYHLATAVAQTYKTMIETQQLSLLQMQCRVHKVPLGGRCWYSGGLPERNLCESSMILKSFNDMEHARRRFSANIPCLGLTSVVSFSDEMTFLCPKCFSDGATFSSPTFSCAAHTHTLTDNTTQTSCFLVTEVPVCQFMFASPLLTWLQAGSKKIWGGGRQWQMAPEILWKAVISTPHKMQFPPATLECSFEIFGDRVGLPTLWWTRYCDELPWMWLDRRTAR